MTVTPGAPRRWLFTLTILAGSFLLFLVQPMVARMALPQLGGAPNVWNSAMLVYQALLLGGYAYAHVIGRFSLLKQGIIHLGVLGLGALTLPLALAEIAPATSGYEALWVPWLFLLTVGPAFFAVSAQAPLVQRWFAAHPHAGNPYPLYAASNLGSFAGLLTYPLIAEPLLPLGEQSLFWAFGYVALIVLVAVAVFSRRGVADIPRPAPEEDDHAPATGWKTIGLWLALSAVPSGLMLSTTTFLTTDIMAIPLLWVIPLGLYLLSFSIAFAESRAIAAVFVFLAPVILLLDGGLSMFAADRSDLLAAFASVILLFVTAVALHARLYDLRPHPSQLTRFYLVMSAGGALGGLFTALVAPVVFDWTWEHPLLILAAAALVPLGPWQHLLARFSKNPQTTRTVLIVSVFVLFNAAMLLYDDVRGKASLEPLEWLALGGILLVAVLMAARRWSYTLATLALLVALGGLTNVKMSLEGMRERSYFGIYSVREQSDGDKVLMHGTTIHGIQRTGENHLEPTAYYGRASGVGLALATAGDQFGSGARIGVVGLGVGTLACYHQPGQHWTFFEIDPVVLSYSRDGQFTFIEQCAPDADMVIGDARIELQQLPADSFDVLVIDAFSSDAIPLHLLTTEALEIYQQALAREGVLLMHISNRYIKLEPMIARLVEARGLQAMVLEDPADEAEELYSSSWVALAETRAPLDTLSATADWRLLVEPEGEVWTDDYASILPYLVWENFL
ncbi:spermidine synthase [Aurantiacibacter gilvus]|uniref:Fused MFS/spermidine synthase n=1 Tax=Aurantiacibacter gilvus TaxID=3139141 RepID=A0ABU9IHW8_9SPHN